jgi:hypothetical protein
MIVVVKPFSRLTLVTVVSVAPLCDVVVVDVAAPELSGKIIVVVFGGGAAGAMAGVWAATGSVDSAMRVNIGMMGFMSRQNLGRALVRNLGPTVLVERTNRWRAFDVFAFAVNASLTEPPQHAMRLPPC